MKKLHLNDAVRIAQLVLSKSSHSPVGRAIRFDAHDDTHVALSATDLTTEIQVVLDGKLDVPLAIEGHLLRKVLDAGADPNLELTFTQTAAKTSLAFGRSTFTFPPVDVVDIPKFLARRDKAPVLHMGKVNVIALLEVGDFVTSAVSTDVTRAALTFMHHFPSGTLVGTDGHRLHVATLPRPLAPFQCAIPLTTYNVLRRVQAALKVGGGTLEIRASASEGETPIEHLLCFTFQTPGVEVSVATHVDLTLTCPDYEAVFNAVNESTTKHVISREHCEEAIEHASKIGFSTVDLDLNTSNRVTLAATDHDVGSVETVLTSLGGALPLSPDRDGILPSGNGLVRLSIPYLLDALHGMSGGVEVWAGGSLDPIRLENPQNQVRALIMPVAR